MPPKRGLTVGGTRGRSRGRGGSWRGRSNSRGGGRGKGRGRGKSGKNDKNVTFNMDSADGLLKFATEVDGLQKQAKQKIGGYIDKLSSFCTGLEARVAPADIKEVFYVFNGTHVFICTTTARKLTKEEIAQVADKKLGYSNKKSVASMPMSVQEGVVIGSRKKVGITGMLDLDKVVNGISAVLSQAQPSQRLQFAKLLPQGVKEKPAVEEAIRIHEEYVPKRTANPEGIGLNNGPVSRVMSQGMLDAWKKAYDLVSVVDADNNEETLAGQFKHRLWVVQFGANSFFGSTVFKDLVKADLEETIEAGKPINVNPVFHV